MKSFESIAHSVSSQQGTRFALSLALSLSLSLLFLLLFLCTNLRFAHFSFITSDVSLRSLQLLHSLAFSIFCLSLSLSRPPCCHSYCCCCCDRFTFVIFCTLFFVCILCVGSDERCRQQRRQWRQRRQQQWRHRRRLRRVGANVTNVAAAIPSESDGDHFHQRGASERTGSVRKPADWRSGANGEQHADRWHCLQHHCVDDQADASGAHAARCAQGVRCAPNGK